LAKIGLAAELAKQAAQAAREEVAASEAVTSGKTAPAKGWTVPVLPDKFMLDTAMQKATSQVAGHYRNVLAPQGLIVSLEDVAGEAQMPAQNTVNVQASLREQGTGRLVKAYTPTALLTLFATQQQATGVVVDGQV
jgi:hypothetical protein